MKTISLYLSLIFLSKFAWAIPSLTNRCGPKGVNFFPPKNATIVAFDENCETAFIGPPLSGEVHLNQTFGNMNLLFCDTIKMFPQTIEAARAGMKIWIERILARTKEYDETAKTIAVHTQKVAELKPLLEQKIEIRTRGFLSNSFR